MASSTDEMSISDKIKLMEILGSMKSQSSESKQQEELMLPVEAYNFYKTNYRKNIQFHPSAPNRNLCKYSFMDIQDTLHMTASYLHPNAIYHTDCFQRQSSHILTYKWLRSTLTQQPMMR